jgi:hypothetical protein
MAIPTPIIRNLDQAGILRTMAIDLSENPEDRAAIIEVLRSKLYSDKILAPIREYSTNAADAHVESGCSNTPIKIVLPTQIYPELRIRDYGQGLTPDEIESIYIKYGRSTKRNTNAQTGQLGLGCKSAFAYGDNFVVISYKEGVKTIYNLTISGVCTIIAAEPMTDDDKPGIEIVVPVKSDDVSEFQNKALQFFKYWKVCPDLKGGDVGRIDTLREELATKPLFSEDDWEIRPSRDYYSDHNGVAVMGNVPYPINWDLISNKINLRSNDKDQILYDFIRSNKTILRFNIGDLDFSASRESLEYTEKTCKVIVAKVRDIFDNIFLILDTKIQTAKSYWEALLIYNQIFGRDDEKLFQGDVYRLENYYKGKFSWNGIKIESGAFEHIEHWDTVLGYSASGTWKNSSGYNVTGCNPIMTTYDNRNGRIKQHRPNEYSNNRIPASTKTIIVIHDLDKPVLTKASVRYIFTQHNQSNKPIKMYFLRFANSSQKSQFFKTMHFESVPVIYVSAIHDKVKEWLKSTRVSNGSPTGQRDPSNVRCFMPADRKNKYGYMDDVSFDRDEIDIHEENGLYVELEDGYAKIGETPIYHLSHLSHYTHILLDVIGEKDDYVYAFPERNRNAKWFSDAVKKKQWIKLEDFFKDKEDQILHGKGAMVAKAAKYYKTCENEHFIGITFAAKILPLLTDKDGAMYKACREITPDFKKMLDLTDALKFFSMSNNLPDACPTDFSGLFKNVKSAYPLIPLLEVYGSVKSNDRDTASLTGGLIVKIADYVNIIDAKNKETKI